MLQPQIHYITPGYSYILNNKTGGRKIFNLWARWDFVAHNNLNNTKKSTLSPPWTWELKIQEISCKRGCGIINQVEKDLVQRNQIETNFGCQGLTWQEYPLTMKKHMA